MKLIKVTTGIISVTQVFMILGFIFALVIFYQLSQEEESYISIADPLIHLEVYEAFPMDKDKQFKIIDSSWNGTKLDLSHGSLSIPIEQIGLSWMLFYGVIRFCIAFIGLYFIKEVIKESRNPFTHKNIKRVRMLAILLIATPFADKLESFIGHQYLKSKIELIGMHLQSISDFNWSVFIGGVLLLVISQVFEYGLKIQNENELTI